MESRLPAGSLMKKHFSERHQLVGTQAGDLKLLAICMIARNNTTLIGNRQRLSGFDVAIWATLTLFDDGKD